MLLEEVPGIPGEFEKPDALGHVGLVGRLVLLDQSQALGLCGSPGHRHAVERRGVDAPVQFVHVHRIQSVLESGVLGLEAFDGLAVGQALVLVALGEGLSDPVQDLLVEDQAIQ